MRPKVFYKYRPANDFTIALLEKQEMKFSFAEEYNDPFDSKLIMNVDSNTDSILQRLEETPFPENRKQNIRNVIKGGEIPKDKYMSFVCEAGEHAVMSSCFAGNAESLLLWSHYADSHKGICIGLRDCSSTDISAMKFNVEGCCTDSAKQLSNGIFLVHKVNYSDSDIVEWKPFEDDFQVFMDAHTNKAKCWEYEEEYRLIVPRGAFKSRILRFDPHFLVEVYLGCRIETGFRTKVLQVLKASYLAKGIGVKVFQMASSKKRFALEKEELEV